MSTNRDAEGDVISPIGEFSFLDHQDEEILNMDGFETQFPLQGQALIGPPGKENYWPARKKEKQRKF